MSLQIEQDLIDELSLTPEFNTLFERVLRLEPGQYLVTDLSTLNDFCGQGMPRTERLDEMTYAQFCDAWDHWIFERIEQEFGLQLDSSNIPLIQLIARMQHQAAPVLH